MGFCQGKFPFFAGCMRYIFFCGCIRKSAKVVNAQIEHQDDKDEGYLHHSQAVQDLSVVDILPTPEKDAIESSPAQENNTDNTAESSIIMSASEPKPLAFSTFFKNTLISSLSRGDEDPIFELDSIKLPSPVSPQLLYPSKETLPQSDSKISEWSDGGHTVLEVQIHSHKFTSDDLYKSI